VTIVKQDCRHRHRPKPQPCDGHGRPNTDPINSAPTRIRTLIGKNPTLSAIAFSPQVERLGTTVRLHDFSAGQGSLSQPQLLQSAMVFSRQVRR
jgi:hypothetical protein